MHIGFEPVGTMAVPNLEWALNIVQKLNLPEVGLVIDDFNLYLWDLLSDVDLICTIPPEKISIVHLNDAEKIPFARLDQTHRCMPSDGRIDIARCEGHRLRRLCIYRSFESRHLDEGTGSCNS